MSYLLWVEFGTGNIQKKKLSASLVLKKKECKKLNPQTLDSIK